MSNIITDISKIYSEQIISESTTQPPMERLKTERNMFQISDDEKKAAKERTLAKAKAMREKKMKEDIDIEEETKAERYKRLMATAATPAQKKAQERQRKGREVLADIQATEKALKAGKKSPTETKPEYNTPEAEVRVLKPGQKKDTLALKAKKAMAEEKKVKKWWDDDGDGKGYEEGEVSGKFKKKKKVKEGFSNWREDLSELSEVLDFAKKKDPNRQIKEMPSGKKNKININPSVSEAIEDLGGTLIEMVEIDDFEGVLDNLSESEIFLLSDSLIEETVEEFFNECLEDGYDISEVESLVLESLEVSSSLLNEAKVTLGHDTKTKSDKLEKVKGAVKKVASGVGYAAGAAVRGAKAIGRAVKSGYSSGRGESSSDSSSKSKESKPGFLSGIGSKLKSGLKKVVAKGARKVARGALGIARKMEGGDKKPSSVHSKVGTREASPRRGIGDGTSVEKVGTSKPTTTQKTAKPKVKTTKVTPVETQPKPKSKKKSSGSLRNQADDILASIRSESIEEFDIIEKTLTAAEKKERERIAKSMNLSDFENRYPGRGMEVKMATATKMAKRMVEQSQEMEPKTQEPKQKPLDTPLERQKYSNLKITQQKQQQLEKQRLNLQKQGRLPLDSH